MAESVLTRLQAGQFPAPSPRLIWMLAKLQAEMVVSLLVVVRASEFQGSFRGARKKLTVLAAERSITIVPLLLWPA